MSEAQPQSRRMERVPGEVYTQAQHDAALLLYNTYRDCCQRTMLSRLPEAEMTGKALKPTQFEQSFKGLSHQKRKDHENVENIEDNPDPDNNKAGRRKQVWLNLAAFVIAHKLDPASYVRAQFEMWPPACLMRRQLPSPETFLNAKAQANYAAARQSLYQELTVAFNTQQSQFRTQVAKARPWLPSDEAAWLEVLGDSSSSMRLSALFRYCLATSIAVGPKTVAKTKFEALAERFLDAAALQYIYAADTYDVVYGKWLPAGFAAQAGVIYKRLHGVDGTQQ